MATGKVIGQIQVAQGNVKIVSVDGAVREPNYDGFVYENEQIISDDPTALFQIKFLALPEASAYDGAFRILADGSVIHGRDAIDSVASDESLVNILKAAGSGDVENLKTAAGTDIGDLETAAGEEGVVGSSSFTETDIVAESSVLGFSRGANGALGFGITDFSGRAAPDFAHTPPAISSPNVVVYDENGTEPVIQVTATGESAVTYSIAGLDSDKFSIDGATGFLTFNNSPDYENPQDLSGDNEYNIYVTATDASGYYTTQLLSVSVNNVNEAPAAVNDTVDAVEDTVLSSTIDLDANDTDVDGSALSVVAGTYATAQGGTLVVAADGSYTYTPAANFHGVDTVNYTVTDGEFSDVGTLTINVASVNDAPVAVDDAVSAVEDTVLTSVIELDANDYDVDGDALSVVAGTFATANGGQLVLASDGTYTYTPAANFNGIDSVNYTVTDGELTDVGTLTINVAAVDEIVIPPIDYTFKDADEFVSDDEGKTQVGTVLENAVDGNGLALSVTAFSVDGSSYNADDTATIVGKGSLTIGSDGTYTFEPEANYNGEVPVATYTVTNGETTDTSTLTIYVNAVSDEFTDSGESVSGIEDTIQTGTVLENATDDNGLPLSVTEFRIDGDDTTYNAGDTATITGKGSLTIDSNGTYTFEPIDNYSGTVPTVIYTVSNGETTDSSALAITVDAAADVPSLSMSIEETEETESEWVVDEDANEAAGIYLGEDGNYYQDTTNTIVSDSSYKEILNTGSKLDFAQLTELADFAEFDMKITGHASGTAQFFNGVTFVGELPLTDGLNSYTPSGQFDNIIFTINVEGKATIHLQSYSIEQIVPTIVDPIMEELTTTVYEYTIIPDAAPTDTDGSETLSGITLDHIPGIGTVVVDNEDGTYTFTSTEQLSSDVLDGITATVISTEGEGGDAATITVNQNGIVSIEAGSGNDTLMGGDSIESIDGGAGNDYINGGSGTDTVYGGAGNDTMVYDIADTEIDGGAGTDTLIANSGAVNLSNISNINIIQLGSGATVVGGVDGINPSDVINATDDGTLIIQSVDNVSNQVNVDTSAGSFVDMGSIIIDGIEYAQYTGAGATLLIEETITVD
ncbi:MAG: Ig-like domain-containing protein [Sulfurimonas sp.]|uniref:tandem-95 repeat protein n=1 Tax=Sulfurimonas sp. TaxID=2022749 RepID=UPI00261A5DFB|nr:Ig-like domain-containing protein [Sulfurimonas sp.]MDD5372133.1 Ig-like domain-containing protein [Sulfurimonas sp.]